MGVRPKPGPAECPAFSLRTRRRRPGRQAASARLSPFLPQPSRLPCPRPRSPVLHAQSNWRGKTRRRSRGERGSQRTRRCDQTFTSASWAVIITTCGPRCEHADSPIKCVHTPWQRHAASQGRTPGFRMEGKDLTPHPVGPAWRQAAGRLASLSPSLSPRSASDHSPSPPPRLGKYTCPQWKASPRLAFTWLGRAPQKPWLAPAPGSEPARAQSPLLCPAAPALLGQRSGDRSSSIKTFDISFYGYLHSGQGS